MKDQLAQYVSLLFAGTENCEDIQQEILQNTLDRYDDLIAEGKPPEAAYRMAISGIGDINEILRVAAHPASGASTAPKKPVPKDTSQKKLLRAIAVGLYVLCAIPLLVLGEMGMDTLGLCGSLAIAAVATVLMVLGEKKEPAGDVRDTRAPNAREELRKSVGGVVWAVGLAVYFILSFATHAWFITWLVFPITGAVQGLIRAILDLKGDTHYE